MRRTARLLLTASIALAGCSEGEKKTELSAVERGKAVYTNVCVACHNGDPTQDGSLGPAVAGSSEELLYAKVIRGEYPPGYTPKRPHSAAMPKFAYLEERIPDLATYLASVQSGG